MPWLVGILLAGCGSVPAQAVPAEPGLAAGQPAVTECLPPLAFEGEATIAELGLEIPGLGAQATRPGTILITENLVAWEQFAPPDVPAVVPEGQMLCVTWADGSGMTTLLAEPFPGRGADPIEEAGSVEVPWAAILVGVAIAVVIGASWFAFRREAPTST
jgi:hypothetical protein